MKTFRKHLSESSLRYITFVASDKETIKNALERFKKSDVYDYEDNDFKNIVQSLIEDVWNDIGVREKWQFAGTPKETRILKLALEYHRNHIEKNKYEFDMANGLLTKIRESE